MKSTMLSRHKLIESVSRSKNQSAAQGSTVPSSTTTLHYQAAPRNFSDGITTTVSTAAPPPPAPPPRPPRRLPATTVQVALCFPHRSPRAPPRTGARRGGASCGAAWTGGCRRPSRRWPIPALRLGPPAPRRLPVGRTVGPADTSRQRLKPGGASLALQSAAPVAPPRRRPDMRASLASCRS